MLVRVVKRKAAWESGFTDDEAIGTEFGAEPDQRDSRIFSDALSTYEIQNIQLVQVLTEHLASCVDPPRASKTVRYINLDDARIPEPMKTRGETKFGLANSLHRELRFSDDSNVRSFVASLSEATFCPVSALEILCHAECRRRADDPEWLVYFANADVKPPRWLRECAKVTTRCDCTAAQSASESTGDPVE